MSSKIPGARVTGRKRPHHGETSSLGDSESGGSDSASGGSDMPYQQGETSPSGDSASGSDNTDTQPGNQSVGPRHPCSEHHPELRVDPGDGDPYPFDSFLGPVLGQHLLDHACVCPPCPLDSFLGPVLGQHLLDHACVRPIHNWASVSRASGSSGSPNTPSERTPSSRGSSIGEPPQAAPNAVTIDDVEWRRLDARDAAKLLRPKVSPEECRMNQTWSIPQQETENLFAKLLSDQKWTIWQCAKQISKPFRLTKPGDKVETTKPKEQYKMTERLKNDLKKKKIVTPDMLRNSRCEVLNQQEFPRLAHTAASAQAGDGGESSDSSRVEQGCSLASTTDCPAPVREEFVQDFAKILDKWSPTAVIIKMFVDDFEQCCDLKDKPFVEYHGKFIRKTFRKTFKLSIEGDTQEAKCARRVHRMDMVCEIETMFKKRKLANKYQTETVNEVLNWFVLKFARTDLQRAEWGRRLDYQEMRSKGDEEEFQAWLDEVDDFCRFGSFIDLDVLVPSHSMGIFLTMPRLLAKFLFFLIKNNASVHDELLRLGYRSFVELNEAEGVEDASGLSTICGYNRCDIRYNRWGDVSQEHRDLTEQLSREFHSRGAAVFVEEEMSEDDAQQDGAALGSDNDWLLEPSVNAYTMIIGEDAGGVIALQKPEDFVNLCLQQPSIQNRLKHIRNAGWTAFHVLADHHGQHMCTLLKAVEESVAIEILSITNDIVQHKSVAAFLVQEHPAELVDLCLARPRLRTALMDIKQGGTCVYGSLSLNHGAQMKRLLEGIEPEEAQEMLQIRVQDSFVGYNLASKFPEEFTHLGVDLLASLKGARHKKGWTAFHTLADHHGQHMCKLLKAVEESEAIEILSITNDIVQYKSVAAFLVQEHPAELVDLCLALPRLRTALMDIKQGGTCVYDSLSLNHGAQMKRLLEGIKPHTAIECGIPSPVTSHCLLERKCNAKGLGEERKGWKKSIDADEPSGNDQNGKSCFSSGAKQNDASIMASAQWKGENVQKKTGAGAPRKASHRVLHRPKHNHLKEWFYANLQHPFPSDEVKAELSHRTGCSFTQLKSWFNMARKLHGQKRKEEALQAHNKEAEASAGRSEIVRVRTNFHRLFNFTSTSPAPGPSSPDSNENLISTSTSPAPGPSSPDSNDKRSPGRGSGSEDAGDGFSDIEARDAVGQDDMEESEEGGEEDVGDEVACSGVMPERAPNRPLPVWNVMSSSNVGKDREEQDSALFLHATIEEIEKSLGKIHKMLVWWNVFKNMYPLRDAAQTSGSTTDEISYWGAANEGGISDWMRAEDHVRAILTGMAEEGTWDQQLEEGMHMGPASGGGNAHGRHERVQGVDAGVKTEGRDTSDCFELFTCIRGQSHKNKKRALFQCMFCPLTKLLPYINEDGTTSFADDVSKKLGKPFAFLNPLYLRINSKMQAYDKKGCGDHNGCLMHRLFETVIGGVNSLSQEDLKSLSSEAKIERELKMLQEAHLKSLKILCRLDVTCDVPSFFKDAAVAGVSSKVGDTTEIGVTAPVSNEPSVAVVAWLAKLLPSLSPRL